MEHRSLITSFFRSLYRIRRVEEEIVRLYPTDKIKSPVHLSIGQESVSVGVCLALSPHDKVFGTYRGHALYLAKGGGLKPMLAELYGKESGCSRGKSGSMHLIDLSAGVMGTSALVASTIPQAVGYAWSIKVRKENTVVAVFFGEGAIDEGVFHESINFAALRSLPILFVCENNSYAIYSHISKRMANPNIPERANTYGVPAQRIDDGNTQEIYNKTVGAVAAIRNGLGPQFLEIMTYRYRSHVGPDEDREWNYRPDSELDSWIAKDEIKRLALEVDDKTRDAIEAEVDAEIAAAIEFAESSPFPGADEVFDHVFS